MSPGPLPSPRASGPTRSARTSNRTFAVEAEAAFIDTGEEQRHFHEVRYAAKTWDRRRRVI